MATHELAGFRRPDEAERIVEMAERFSIDPRFLAALREAEDGGPGRQFGVLAVPAPTYDDQAEVAARTIARTLIRYKLATGHNPIDEDGRYTEAFIQYFSHGGPNYPGYAPLGAENDPTDLNANHYRNLSAAYRRIDYA